MRLRIVAGLTAGVLLVCIIYFAPIWFILGLVLFLSGIAYLEYDKLFFGEPNLLRQTRLIAMIASVILGISQSLVYGSIAFWLSFILLSLYHVFHSSRSGAMEKSTRALAFELLGLVYITGMFAFLVPIAKVAFGRDFLLLFFMLVFCGDTAAYFVGTWMGRHTLAERLSPKKSVEGAIGALVFSCVAAGVWANWIYRGCWDHGFFWKLMLFSPFASVLAQLGDLFESMFKRSQSQKDSGQFLPGHGGLLDRLDGVVLVAPMFYVYLILILSCGE